MYNMRRYWPISPAVLVVMTDPQLDDDIIATCINKNKQNNYYCISFYRVCLKKTLQNDICIRRTAEFYMESHYCHQNEEVNTYIATERNSVITDVRNMRMWVKPSGFFPESSWCWMVQKFYVLISCC